MKEYFIRYILRKVFNNSPYAVLSEIHQSGKGWVTVLTDSENGQEYLVTLVPIESEVRVEKTSTAFEGLVRVFNQN